MSGDCWGKSMEWAEIIRKSIKWARLLGRKPWNLWRKWLNQGWKSIESLGWKASIGWNCGGNQQMGGSLEGKALNEQKLLGERHQINRNHWGKHRMGRIIGEKSIESLGGKDWIGGGKQRIVGVKNIKWVESLGGIVNWVESLEGKASNEQKSLEKALNG